jgi:hypothetical protein
VITVPVLIVVLIVLLLLVAMMQSYQSEMTMVDVREVVTSVWDLLKWAWKQVVKIVTVVWTVIVTLWKLIWVVVTYVVEKTVVIYKTIIKHIPDKKKPRNNHKAERNNGNKGNQGNRGNQGRGNQGKPKAQEGNPAAKPQPPRAPRNNPPKQTKGPQQTPRKLGREPKPEEPLFRGTREGGNPHELRPGTDFKVDANGMVKPTHGMSVNNSSGKMAEGGWNPRQLDLSTVDRTRLMIRQTGKDLGHFEIMPARAGELTTEQFLNLIRAIRFL